MTERDLTGEPDFRSTPYPGIVRPTDEPPTDPAAQFEVKTIRGIIQLRHSWWRHPILWWKTRHILPDVRREQQIARELVGDERFEALQAEMRRREEEAFLHGTGARPGTSRHGTL